MPCYGTIRMHQEREYPGRVSATDLVNPDFAAMARSFGGFGATVEKTEDFAPAFLAAEASGLPSIIHVKFDAEGITPTHHPVGDPGKSPKVPSATGKRLAHRQHLDARGGHAASAQSSICGVEP